MDRLEVRALLGPSASTERAAAAPVERGICVDDALDEEAFLKALEEALQQHAAALKRQFLELSAAQVDRLAFRLHDALVPKRDADTRVVQAWTIQPQLQLKVKASAHIQVLKLSTILREVQRLRLHQSQPSQPPIEVDIFPSLRVIEALNTEARGLQNVHFFAGQLRELHIEHTQVPTLRQLLAPREGQQRPWRKLLKLHMNCCALEEVDESVNLLRAVRTLDLGWNQIERFGTSASTRSLEILNLCHNQLKEVPPIQSLRALRELDLAVNRISSLKGLEKLTALERLDVSHNLIDDITEVELLMRLPRLTYVKMEFNPIARRPDYRREVLFYLGEPIELDGRRWSDAEVSSMKKRRMLLMLEGEKEHSIVDSGIWGQSVESPVYPKVRVQSGLVVKNPKLVLGYPLLPRSKCAPAHYVEIMNPPSTLPTTNKHQSSVAGRSIEASENGDKLCGTSQGPHNNRQPVRSVDEYFRTQRDVIVAKERKERKESLDQITTSEEGDDSDDSTSGKRRTRSRKYTSQLPQKPGRSISVRVLLSAKEAAELDLHFGIDGVPANVEVKPRELIERFTVSDATDASSGSGMHECVMISCNGIREVATPPVEQMNAGNSREVHSDEWNDAIVQAMTTTMR
ncbi:Leucine-rich repeat protein [Phytophthora cinnamomi]|uniref:Leucine-rich repeat protein n=1 Tax=Phytophthora cinnamomi TaxID=4785 RepID=UPI0035597689|nr:Leucine-rich repeat protein [Phytophthora cinnamomi]